jgi:hypothetical protein
MADQTLTILGVHGLGDQRHEPWKEKWEAAVHAAFPETDGVSLDFRFLSYDDLFDGTEISAAETVEAVAKLAASGVGSMLGRGRGLFDGISEKLRWTAGYVVAWVSDEGFQRETRRLVLDAIREHRPDVILAHSLGSLVTYNALAHPDAHDEALANPLSNARYVTLGSQLGNPFVKRNLTNGRIQPLAVRSWHHLYNPNDRVFTAPLSVPEMDKFRQVQTTFDTPGWGAAGLANHDAELYLTNAATIDNLWEPIAAHTEGTRSFAVAPRSARTPAAVRQRTQKAVLIGINEYPDPAQRLEGCVNDVFTMSSVLQDCGFPADAIRVCLDDRATAAAIRERLAWLVEDARGGDELVFYYSGHGTRYADYGPAAEPDHYVETLVPWDFDWTPERSVTDDQIFWLYSQLPYDCRLALIFDCCYAAGMPRGAQRARGLSPPDDIRHRELKWDGETQMWVARDFERINDRFTQDKEVADEYFGRGGATYRIGRGAMLRGLSQSQYRRLKKQGDPSAAGPYLPLIIEACGEDELSYEYRHGAISHGAFTFSLASILRKRKRISFERLVAETRDRLAELRYPQEPHILGPTELLRARVPFTSG